MHNNGGINNNRTDASLNPNHYAPPPQYSERSVGYSPYEHHENVPVAYVSYDQHRSINSSINHCFALHHDQQHPNSFPTAATDYESAFNPNLAQCSALKAQKNVQFYGVAQSPPINHGRVQDNSEWTYTAPARASQSNTLTSLTLHDEEQAEDLHDYENTEYDEDDECMSEENEVLVDEPDVADKVSLHKVQIDFAEDSNLNGKRKISSHKTCSVQISNTSTSYSEAHGSECSQSTNNCHSLNCLQLNPSNHPTKPKRLDLAGRMVNCLVSPRHKNEPATGKSPQPISAKQPDQSQPAKMSTFKMITKCLRPQASIDSGESLVVPDGISSSSAPHNLNVTDSKMDTDNEKEESVSTPRKSRSLFIDGEMKRKQSERRSKQRSLRKPSSTTQGSSKSMLSTSTCASQITKSSVQSASCNPNANSQSAHGTNQADATSINNNGSFLHSLRLMRPGPSSSASARSYTANSTHTTSASQSTHSNTQSTTIKSIVYAKVPFFRPSRFSNMPPTIRFTLPCERVEKPDRRVRRLLCWCHNSLTPKVMRKCLLNSHFTIVDENHYWMGYWGRHINSKAFRKILPYQKINHCAGTFHLGRKDRLWTHIERSASLYGAKQMNIMPQTYIIPRELNALKHYLKHQNTDRKTRLILKPPALARGSGIRVVGDWKQVPRNKELVAQQYVDRPFLINGRKFDLRLYVFIASFDPLRLYLYEDGLVRFASEKYTDDVCSLSNQYVHLTNYSINKHNQTDTCDKWSLRAFWLWLTERGHNVSQLMEQIVDVILKAVISCESSVVSHQHSYVRHTFTSCELLGFDVLLDSDLKPWLLEINISPSLQSATDLDRDIKQPLARDCLNLAGLNVPDLARPCTPPMSKSVTNQHLLLPNPPCAPTHAHSVDYRVKCITSYLTDAEKDHQLVHMQHYEHTNKVDASILSGLSDHSADLRLLMETEDEYDRRGQFTRLFPSPFSSNYLRFFDRVRYSDLLLDEWTSKYFAVRNNGCDILEEFCRLGKHFAPNSAP